MANIWDNLLSEQDKAIIKKAGYEKLGAATWDSRALGRRPAIVVIDMQYQQIGRDVPILEAVEDERTAMGSVAWRAMDYIVPFVEAAREVDLTVIYTRVIPRGRKPHESSVQIVEQLAPKEDDVVLDKNYSSAFYGTGLLTHLNRRRIDTVIVIGNSTSGCVRATAVDARQMGFSVLVPIECTFDRIEASHKIGLLDLWMKYATVMPYEEALAYLNEIKEEN